MGAIMLIAGTCIGSGMIALPMVFAKIGIFPSIVVMFSIWIVMYYTSLIHLELNLHAGHGLPLPELARYFSGKKAEIIGFISLKLLSYSLLAVFIYGGASILRELLAYTTGNTYSFTLVTSLCSLTATGILLLPLRTIDYLNRLLFIGLLGVIALLIGGLFTAIDWSHIPWLATDASSLTAWQVLIPVVFTSFGFQVIFHTLTNYCNSDAKMLKQVFFWGSAIPAFVYLLWTSSVLSAIYCYNPLFYTEMAKGNVQVGALIHELSAIAKWPAVQMLVWLISLLAIATSLIGVGIGLFETIKRQAMKRRWPPGIQRFSASILTILPAYLAAIAIPNAFIAVLGFAGMILAVIAIILPLYLFKNIQAKDLHYKELRYKGVLGLCLAVALIVCGCELWNLQSKGMCNNKLSDPAT